LEFQPGMLAFPEEARVPPGSTRKVTARSPHGTFTLAAAGGPVGLSASAPSRILASAAPAA